MPDSTLRLTIGFLVLSTLAALSTAVAQSPEVGLPYSEGFEGAGPGLPAGWVNASEGELAVVFSAETQGVKDHRQTL